MLRKLIFAALVLAVTSCGLCCSCISQTMQKRFCEADLSIRGRILATYDNCPGKCDPFTDQVSGGIFYIVQVVETFKGATIEDNLLYLRTAVNNALCGTSLMVGRFYLLNIRNFSLVPQSCPSPMFHISLCDGPTLFGSLSQEEKDFVRVGENAGCPGGPMEFQIGFERLEVVSSLQ